MAEKLNPENALIFRISHVANVPWILENGMWAASSGERDEQFVSIGNSDVITRRDSWTIEGPISGVLSEFIPFYFTPYSVMMYNIHTGHNGVPRRSNGELVVFVSSIHRLKQLGIPFVFSDQHACTVFAEFFSEVEDLKRIDWPLLQSRDFRRDANDPGKLHRYQAEALVHGHLPVEAFKGIACHSEKIRQALESDASKHGLNLPVKVAKGWYF